jgi:hypothetical protein
MRMLRLSLTLLCSCPLSASCASAAAGLPDLPPGATLPVSLETSLDAKHVRVGQPVVVHLVQRVPLAGGGYLPAKARVVGSVTGYDGHSLSLRFGAVKLKAQTKPVELRLRAAAYWLDADHARDPLDGGDRGTSSPADWTTRQIGRDEVYRSGGAGTVYNQYSEPVGHADLEGVYAAPVAGAPARAMGPFSTTSDELYDLPDLRLSSAGGADAPIVFAVDSPKWKLDTATALLLEVVAP